MNIEKSCMRGKYETIILDLVDDLDEAETSDIKKFGRFCCVGCWTIAKCE